MVVTWWIVAFLRSVTKWHELRQAQEIQTIFIAVSEF